ncbi:MAG: hypothetical protein U0529_07245 [Thermoanaerobaculia bacterium]
MADVPARIATVPVPVVLGLADGAQVDATLRLVAEGDPPKPVPVESLLAGPRAFFAVALAGGGSALVARSSVVTVEMAPDAPGAPSPGEADAGIDIVTFHLDNGRTVSGVLHVLPEQADQRMSDIFNSPGGWVVAGLGDRIVLVNKARIARVSF